MPLNPLRRVHRSSDNHGPNVTIALSEPSRTFTTVDNVSGHVSLVLLRLCELVAVDVHLEAISARRISDPKHSSKQIEEVHQLYHQLIQLWGFYRNGSPATVYHKMTAGSWSRPFNFQLPVYSSCPTAAKSSLQPLQSILKKSTQQLQALLPPSLTELSEFAGVVYCIRAEVRTKDVPSEGPVAHQLINFVPLDVPQPSPYERDYYTSRYLRVSPPQKPSLR